MPEINVTMGDGGAVAVNVTGISSYADADVERVLAAGVPAVDTDELSVTHNNEPTVTKEVVFKATDTDTATPLSFDTGALPTHDEFRVRATVGGHGSGGLMDAQYTVNGFTGAGYRYTRIGDVVERIEGNTAWVEKIWSRYNTTLDVTIRGPPDTAFVSFGPHISGDSSGFSINRIDHGNIFDSTVLPVSSIQLSTTQNAVADLSIVGVDY